MAVTAWAVEVVEGVLVGSSTLATYHQIFMVVAAFYHVSESETSGALR